MADRATDFPTHPVYGGEIRARHTHGARDTRASYVNNAGIRTVAIQFSTCSGSVSPPTVSGLRARHVITWPPV